MRKFSPFFSSLILVSAVAAALVTTNVHAAVHHGHNVENAYQEFRPFAENTPKFSGIYANLGLAYNMAPGVSYTDTFTPTGLMNSDVDAKSSGGNFVSGLIKLGYAFRMGQTGYLGVAGFYNLSAQQKPLNTTYQYAQAASSPVTISNTVTQNPGYGLMLQPGIIVTPYSLVYANVGLQMSSVKFATQQNAVDPSVANPLSTTQSVNSYILGVGYQHQMSFIKAREARNLMWFAELNYGLGSKVSVAQKVTPPEVTPLTPARDETYSFTPGAVQVAVGINYYF